MTELTHLLNPNFGPVAIIRPTSTRNSGAVAAVRGLTADGVFIGDTLNGKSDGFVELLERLAEEADEARRRLEGKSKDKYVCLPPRDVGVIARGGSTHD